MSTKLKNQIIHSKNMVELSANYLEECIKNDNITQFHVNKETLEVCLDELWKAYDSLLIAEENTD